MSSATASEPPPRIADASPTSRDPEPPGAHRAVETMDRVEQRLQRDARLSGDAITRPHALLVTAWRTLVSPNGRAQERLGVVFAPAAVWDRGARAPRAVRRPSRGRHRAARARRAAHEPRPRRRGQPAAWRASSTADPTQRGPRSRRPTARSSSSRRRRAPRRAAAGCGATGTSSASCSTSRAR